MSETQTVADALDWLAQHNFVRIDANAQELRTVVGDIALGDYNGPVPGEITSMLVEVGAAVVVGPDDYEDMEDAYAATLDEVVACTNGAVSITDVAIAETEDEDGCLTATLTFGIDGKSLSWDVSDCYEDGYIDAMTFVERIDELTPTTGSRRWGHAMGEGVEVNTYIFGEPSDLRALATWGLDMFVHDDAHAHVAPAQAPDPGDVWPVSRRWD